MQRNHLFKQVTFLALILSAASSCFAASEVDTTSSGFLSSTQKSYEELYSKSSSYEEYDLIADTRVRVCQPLQRIGYRFKPAARVNLDSYAEFYHPVNRKDTQGDVEGLLVSGGGF